MPVRCVGSGVERTDRGSSSSMTYDKLGFPIPPGFEDAAAGVPGPPSRRATRPGRGKRLILLAALAAVIPALAAPAALPVIRAAVVRWSVQRAIGCEARGQPAGAIGNLGRALAWSGDDAVLAMELLCWRAALKLDTLDAAGAAADASRAADVAPLAARPRQVRALVNVVLAQPDAAVADAEAAVQLAGATDPEALNHRAYVRALVRRDLSGALADIEAALAGDPEPAAELLDTRGYVLHLVGRHQEAVDDLNRAIAMVEERRRAVAALARRGARAGVARELRALDRDLAVMHHHRGLACRAAGLEAQAEQDLEIAERKGFDPSRGVM